MSRVMTDSLHDEPTSDDPRTVTVVPFAGTGAQRLPATSRARSAPVACSIAVRDIHLSADIGIHAHEIGNPQPLILHVQLAVVPPERDSFEDVFDYTKIKAMAQRLSGQRVAVIEIFARRIAEECFAHPLVLGAVVMVEKPNAIPGSMTSATVRLGDVPV